MAPPGGSERLDAATASVARRSSISWSSSRSRAARYSADSPGNVMLTNLPSCVDDPQDNWTDAGTRAHRRLRMLLLRRGARGANCGLSASPDCGRDEGRHRLDPGWLHRDGLRPTGAAHISHSSLCSLHHLYRRTRTIVHRGRGFHLASRYPCGRDWDAVVGPAARTPGKGTR
jgi:hypothetical protein